LSAHFLLTTFGSFGDLHPYIAVGIGLRDRGHRVTIATSENYRAKVEGEGLNFYAVRPDLSPLLDRPEIIARAFHPRRGSEYIMRDLFLPCVEQSCEDLMRIAPEADLLVGHAIAFATPTVAEALGKKWISVALQPSIFLSAFDPPVVSGMPLARWLATLGPGFWRQWAKFAKSVVRRWGQPLNHLRRKLGLPALANPLLDDMFSRYGTQAWFCSVIAKPQPDWPANTTVTGFPFYDKLGPGSGLSSELKEFLDAGPVPVVFTLGSSAVFAAGRFFEESARAAQRLGVRAMLLVGSEARNRPQRILPKTIAIADYAPYSELFPRAAAVVHQGGIGTTAQAIRAGRPMLVTPFSHDQPDNAARMERLGAARVLALKNYRAERVAGELQALLERQEYLDSATRVARVVTAEEGVRAACDGLEAALAN
jgi:UDP:flavonoid glycosyltransferase YjiC (YdhE family)